LRIFGFPIQLTANNIKTKKKKFQFKWMTVRLQHHQQRRQQQRRRRRRDSHFFFAVASKRPSFIFDFYRSENHLAQGQ